jgi:PTS system mannitol-specific IIC component
MLKQNVQKLGRFLSAMVMPNLGAFIAWGLITALFIPTGWTPNANLSTLVDPMIKYLLPLLIGYTGGKMLYDVRGGVVGALATIGVIIGTGSPMFLGAMAAGPLGGWVIKKFDEYAEGKIPAGFEMLVNNFSAGILGGILTIICYVGIGPLAEGITSAFGSGVGWLVERNMLPFASILVEPAKILFLNNAINHGVFTPLGTQQALETGRSIYYMIESNPGPGLGLLLAYWMVGKGSSKASAPGAIIIHFFGGIHEIYFPYVLMNPVLILAMMGGGFAGVLTLVTLKGGLIAPASPGSIFAEMMMTPKGYHFANLAGIGVAAAVSFVLSSMLLKVAGKDDEDLESAQAATSSMKAESKGIAAGGPPPAAPYAPPPAAGYAPAPGYAPPPAPGYAPPPAGYAPPPPAGYAPAPGYAPPPPGYSAVKKIVFACDAGMGSSAMGATKLRKKVQAAGFTGITVVHSPVSEVPADADVIVCHHDLQERARASNPRARIVAITDFLSAPEYDTLVQSLRG